jgi:hypothetical protein
MKFIKESELITTKIKRINLNGLIFSRVIKEIQTKPLKLGSIKKPLNKDILRFKYKI